MKMGWIKVVVVASTAMITAGFWLLITGALGHTDLLSSLIAGGFAAIVSFIGVNLVDFAVWCQETWDSYRFLIKTHEEFKAQR